MQVHIADLQLEPDCERDFLEARVGQWQAAPVIGRWCGSRQAFSLDARDNLLLVLKTDAQGVARGFSGSVTTRTNACGGTLRQPLLLVTLPGKDGGDGDYANNLECVWLIDVDPSFRVNVSFPPPFDVERDERCSKDYLQIEEWYSGKWLELARLCGHDAPSPLVTRSHRVRLTFRSDEAVTAAGLRFRYHAVCGSTLFDEQGYVTSPNYPDNYPKGVACFLILSPGNLILLSFDEFALEGGGSDCPYDAVSVFSGQRNSSDARAFGPFCGREEGERLPPTHLMSRGEMLVRFTTDASVEYPGFKARFQTMSCGGRLQQESGLIASPTLPPDVRVNCSWTIVVSPDHVVSVKFRQIHMRYCRDCASCDHIVLRDGSGSTAEQLPHRLL